MKAMKTAARAALALLLSAAGISLASCFAKQDLLAYQKYPLTADCTLIYGGADPAPDAHFSVEVSSPGEARLIFTDGELSGAVITVSGNGARLSDASGFEVPLDLPEGAPILAVTDAFSIVPETLVALIPGETEGDGTVRANCAGGKADVSVKSGAPRMVGFTGPRGSFTLAIDRFANNDGNR